MKPLRCISLLLLLTCGAAMAQETAYSVRIKTVEKSAERRTLSQIGEQKSPLDSTILRESITASLADLLGQHTSIFVKSYGRGTLSTVSLRGTSPSHTQVLWNGMKINSPMLGQVDFSLIPSYFIDEAAVYHGASSVNSTGGGLGGSVNLATAPVREQGAAVKFIQGIGSYRTFDEFLRMDYAARRWQSSTRVLCTDSRNDFKYTNYRKKEFIYDQAGDITGYTYPVEHNRNGDFRDLHLMEELRYDAGQAGSLSAAVWYMNSRRGVPMLMANYRNENESRNQQDERTLRAVASWSRARDNLKLSARAGYTYTDMLYRYLSDIGTGTLAEMVHSQSYVNTLYGFAGADYFVGTRWMFTANVTVHQHFVRSLDESITNLEGHAATVGYDEARFELSGLLSAKWQPADGVGVALSLREELYGDRHTPPIPAAFFDWRIMRWGELTLKASVARNYRYPTLNDLYFMPGGNPDLRCERGFTYDGGVEMNFALPRLDLKAEITGFDSHIRDWILWLPTFKGFWSPVNVKKVHSYGCELKVRLKADMGRQWSLDMDGNLGITHAINHGDPVNWADQSIGRQLVYIPVYSSGVTGRLGWRRWLLGYKWSWYSERFTTSSNETQTKVGRLGAYVMNDVSLARTFAPRWGTVVVRGAVNNLFNEEYVSVLSRPMARRNFGIYVEFTPRLNK